MEMSHLMSTNRRDQSVRAEVQRMMDFVVKARGLKETVASGNHKTRRIFLKSPKNLTANLLHERKNLVMLIDRSVHQRVWKTNLNPSTAMLGHSFQAGLSVYRADIKLHFTRRVFPQGIFQFQRERRGNMCDMRVTRGNVHLRYTAQPIIFSALLAAICNCNVMS